MNIEFTRSFLLWCTVINYGILLVWFLVFAIANDWMRRFHGRWGEVHVDLSVGMEEVEAGPLGRPSKKLSRRKRIEAQLKLIVCRLLFHLRCGNSAGLVVHQRHG